MINNIKGGATIWARKTIESEIFSRKPDVWFKIWFYIVNYVNHKNNKWFNRGSNYFNYKQIQEEVGCTKDQIKHCISYLKSASMIATHKTTRGLVITVVKYGFYQKLDNYGYEKKPHEKPHKSHTINKNDKNENTLPETSSVRLLEKKEKNMKKNSFRYNENQSSDTFESVIDLDSGGEIVDRKTNLNLKDMELIKWAEDRRGFKFLKTMIMKQRKAFKIARENDISPKEIKDRWQEFETDKFWSSKGFDFMDVVISFNKKR